MVYMHLDFMNFKDKLSEKFLFENILISWRVLYTQKEKTRESYNLH